MTWTAEDDARARTGYMVEPANIEPQFKYGRGPYPVIFKDPSHTAVVSNLSRQDVGWGLLFPILTSTVGYLGQRSFRAPIFKVALLLGLGSGAVNAYMRPYFRLKGLARNDDEAARYLHWKKPIYYDSDFLLAIPPDVENATIVTQNVLNLPEHLRAKVKQSAPS